VLQLAAQAAQMVGAPWVALPAALLPYAQHSDPLARAPAASRRKIAAARVLLDAAAAAWDVAAAESDEESGDDDAE